MTTYYIRILAKQDLASSKCAKGGFGIMEGVQDSLSQGRAGQLVGAVCASELVLRFFLKPDDNVGGAKISDEAFGHDGEGTDHVVTYIRGPFLLVTFVKDAGKDRIELLDSAVVGQRSWH
jgi:hypothetical protein